MRGKQCLPMIRFFTTPPTTTTTTTTATTTTTTITATTTTATISFVPIITSTVLLFPSALGGPYRSLGTRRYYRLLWRLHRSLQNLQNLCMGVGFGVYDLQPKVHKLLAGSRDFVIKDTSSYRASPLCGRQNLTYRAN